MHEAFESVQDIVRDFCTEKISVSELQATSETGSVPDVGYYLIQYSMCCITDRPFSTVAPVPGLFLSGAPITLNTQCGPINARPRVCYPNSVILHVLYANAYCFLRYTRTLLKSGSHPALAPNLVSAAITV